MRTRPSKRPRDRAIRRGRGMAAFASVVALAAGAVVAPAPATAAAGVTEVEIPTMDYSTSPQLSGDGSRVVYGCKDVKSSDRLCIVPLPGGGEPTMQIVPERTLPGDENYTLRHRVLDVNHDGSAVLVEQEWRNDQDWPYPVWSYCYGSLYSVGIWYPGDGSFDELDTHFETDCDYARYQGWFSADGQTVLFSESIENGPARVARHDITSGQTSHVQQLAAGEYLRSPRADLAQMVIEVRNHPEPTQYEVRNATTGATVHEQACPAGSYGPPDSTGFGADGSLLCVDYTPLGGGGALMELFVGPAGTGPWTLLDSAERGSCADGEAGGFWGISFAPDGSWVLYERQLLGPGGPCQPLAEQSVVRVDLDSGTRVAWPSLRTKPSGGASDDGWTWVGVSPEFSSVVYIAEPPLFTDVGWDHPFVTEIGWMVDEGITTGYADGSFKPTASVTRQALAAFLYRASGSPDGADPTCSAAQFSDVPASHPFCGEIAWMVAEGITGGYNDGTFRPTAPITRMAVSAFLFRWADQVKGPSCAGTSFPDVPASHPFCQEIAWMVAEGITTGYADGFFKPTAPISRQAAAAFLYRAAT